MKLKQSKIIFNALADETRLRILSLLSEGELCVCDIMRVLKEPQSKVSRHLAYLRRCHLVETRKQGLWIYYRVSSTQAKTFSELIRVIRGNREGFAELRKDKQVLKRSKNCLVSCCD